MIRLLLSLCLFAFLSGCYLKSEQALVTPSRLTPLDTVFTIVPVNDDGKYKIDDKGVLKALRMRRNKDGYYTVDDNKKEGPYAFAPLPGTTDWVIQQPQKNSAGKTTGYAYFLLRFFGDYAAVESFSSTKAITDKLHAQGITLTSDSNQTWATTRPEMEAALRALRETKQNSLSKMSGFDQVYRLAQGKTAADALYQEAGVISCLAQAGHPLDPAVRRLPGLRGEGAEMDTIKAASAQAACRAARDYADTESVRFSLARAYYAGRNYDEANKVVKQMIGSGQSLGMLLRGDMLNFGRGVKKDHDQLKKEMTYLAETGDPLGYYMMGLYMAYNTFGQKDYAGAKRYLEQAANAGVARAYPTLAYLAKEGRTGPKDLSAAYRYYLNGASGGDRLSQREVGAALYHGNGVAEDRVAAYPWLKRAADRGDVIGNYYTGFMLSRGQGVKKNESNGYKYLKIAADRGNISAKGELGRLLYDGKGVKADKEKGLALLREAVKAGNKNAKMYLDNRTGKSGTPAPAPKSDDGGMSRITPEKKTSIDNVPSERKSDVDNLLAGKPIRLTEANIPFMAGMANNLMERCGNPKDSAKRLRLAGFVATSTTGAMVGNSYSDPDLGKAWGGAVKSQTLLGLGAKAAETVTCGAVSERIATGIHAALKSDEQGSVFVKGCTPVHGQSNCTCLANTGRQVIPDLHRRAFHRDLIYQIIQGNPFIGLQIALTCGISNY